MVERINELSKESDLTVENRVILALARAQGHWNKKSKDLLRKDSEELLALERKTQSKSDQIITGLVLNTALAFLGDTSKARALLGHRVILPEKDRGLIILGAALERDKSTRFQDWVMLSLIASDVNSGKSLESTLSHTNKGLESMKKLSAGIMRKEEVEDLERRVPKSINHLIELTGGSEEALLENKKDLEGVIVNYLTNSLIQMKSEKLASLLGLLSKKIDDDDVLTTSFSAGRGIVKGVLQKKILFLNKVLDQF